MNNRTKFLMSIDQIRDEVKRITGVDSIKDDGVKVGIILIAGLGGVRSIKKLSLFTGISPTFVKQTRQRLISGGIWKGNVTRANWFDKDDGGIAFLCDINVGLGLLKRA